MHHRIACSTVLATFLFLAPGCKSVGSSTAAIVDDSAAPGDSISAAGVQAHVDDLVLDSNSEDYTTRPEARVVADYIAGQFTSYGLTPMGDDGSWFQEVGEGYSPNVIGVIRGSVDGCIVISAHYDRTQPIDESAKAALGSEPDNDSGVAALLEVAQAFGESMTLPHRSLVFVAFTAEDQGLRGSRFFVDERPEPVGEMGDLGRIVGDINLDLSSKDDDRSIYCEAGGGSRDLVEAVEAANERVGLPIRFGKRPESLEESDQDAFLERGIPAIKLGIESHPSDHASVDTDARVRSTMAAKVAKLVFDAARTL